MLSLPKIDIDSTTLTSGVVSVGGSVTGAITLLSGKLDRDWFKVTLEAGNRYRIDVKGSDTGFVFGEDVFGFGGVPAFGDVIV